MLLACFMCISCGKNPSGNESNETKMNCPDSAFYFSQIEIIKKFQLDRLDTTPHFDQPSYDFSLDDAFVKAILYLDSTTGLQTHVDCGYLFQYADTGDYQHDINQYSNWYHQHCRESIR